MADKLTRKELKAPDAFQKVGADARDWLQERMKFVALAVVVLLLGGAGVALASYVNGRGEEKAARELGMAMKVLERPVVENAPETPPEDQKEPPFRSEHDKDQAVAQALTAFRDSHKGTRAAITAALTLAQAELRLGQLDNALTHFSEYAKESPSEWPLHASAVEGQGYAYEAKGQYDQALTAFDQLSKESKGDFLVGMGQYHRARILVQQGKKEDAAKEFAQLVADHPNTAAARMATERLAILASEGIKTPAINKPDAG